MANITASAGSVLNGNLMQILMCDDIEPGTDPGYELCKLIYVFHPLGGKMVDRPIKLAMSQKREISIPNSPEEPIREAFDREWEAIGADRHIENVVRLARIYGASALAMGAEDIPTDAPIPLDKLSDLKLYFQDLDALNTAGSLVLNQDPNAVDFLKPTIVTAAGVKYHPSRCLVFFNEQPIYLQFTTSAFGYTGRSVFQRALYPLKSFIQTMLADDMISRKVGVIVAKMKPAGSIADRAMAALQGVKRNVVKEAATNNVINITPEESIETLNLLNADGALTTARKNILENIACAADMPAKILNSESYAEGFGEGTEDAKDLVRYVEGLRRDMQPLYAFFEKVVMHRAWTEDFYKTIQNTVPEYADMPYQTAFHQWKNAFHAQFPSLLVEPESELVKVEKIKNESIVSTLAMLLPNVDPANRARAIEWAANNLSESKKLFPNPLVLDYETLQDYAPPQGFVEPPEPKLHNI